MCLWGVTELFIPRVVRGSEELEGCTSPQSPPHASVDDLTSGPGRPLPDTSRGGGQGGVDCEGKSGPGRPHAAEQTHKRRRRSGEEEGEGLGEGVREEVGEGEVGCWEGGPRDVTDATGDGGADEMDTAVAGLLDTDSDQWGEGEVEREREGEGSWGWGGEVESAVAGLQDYGGEVEVTTEGERGAGARETDQESLDAAIQSILT